MDKILLGIGIAYIAFFTGLAAADLGEIVGGTTFVMDADMVFKIFVFAAFPFLIGFLAGYSSEK